MASSRRVELEFSLVSLKRERKKKKMNGNRFILSVSGQVADWRSHSRFIDIVNVLTPSIVAKKSFLNEFQAINQTVFECFFI